MTEEIKLIVSKISNNPQLKITSDFSLINSGILDSLTIIQLVNEIEDYFGIMINEEDLTIENFTTIVQIEKLIKKYKKGN